MSETQLATIQRFAISGILLVAALIAGVSLVFVADTCSDSASEISTDRPDTTNSSRIVPYRSLQAENGVDWTLRQGSNVISGTETRLRLGIAQCTEVLADVPTYFYSLNGRASSGFPTSSSPSSGSCPFHSATRFSRRLRAEQQFSRPLFRDRVFVSPRRAIRRFGW